MESLLGHPSLLKHLDLALTDSESGLELLGSDFPRSFRIIQHPVFQLPILCRWHGTQAQAQRSVWLQAFELFITSAFKPVHGAKGQPSGVQSFKSRRSITAYQSKQHMLNQHSTHVYMYTGYMHIKSHKYMSIQRYFMHMIVRK